MSAGGRSSRCPLSADLKPQKETAGEAASTAFYLETGKLILEIKKSHAELAPGFSKKTCGVSQQIKAVFRGPWCVLPS